MGFRRWAIAASAALLGSFFMAGCTGGSGNSRMQELDCSDGLDQDRDGLTDCLDPDCRNTAACSGVNPNVESNCSNGVDDDADGSTDCDDADCANLSVCGGTLTGDCSTNAQTLSLPSDVRSGSLAATDPDVSPRGSGYYTDAYEFTATAGTAVTFELTEGSFDTYLYLLDDSCTELEYDDDGGSGTLSSLTYTFSTTGTYILQVTSFGTGTTGTYTLQVSGAAPTTEINCTNGVDDDSDGYVDCDDADCASTSDCTSLSCAAGVCLCNPVTGFSVTAGAVVGSLDSTDPTEGNPRGTSSYYDAYEFSGTAGQSVYFEMTAAGFDTYLYLLGPSCEIVDSDDDGAGYPLSLISTTLSTSGTHTLVVTSFGSGDTGSYTLSAGG